MKRIVLLTLMFSLIFSISVQAVTPGRTYLDREQNNFKYIVKAGNTLYELSRKFQVNLNQLKEKNNIFNSNSLRSGDKLSIDINKDLKYYIVKPGNTIFEISKKSHLSLNDIIAYNSLEKPDFLLVNEVVFLPDIIAENENIKVLRFDKIKNRVYIAGVARVFEATVNYAFENQAGKVLKEGFTTATIGGPQWGKFQFEVTDIPKKARYLLLFTISAKDGSRKNIIRLQLKN